MALTLVRIAPMPVIEKSRRLVPIARKDTPKPMARVHLLPLTLLLIALSPVASLAQQPAKNTQAQTHYDAGLAYVDDPSGPKWEEALREFRAAYKASGQWKLQNNIGLCALNLERDQEAIEAYRDYLARSGDDLPADKRKQIEKDVATLSASLVHVEVGVEPGEASVVDERKNSKGEVVSNRYQIVNGKVSLGIHPGHHKLTIEANGYVSGEWSFEAEPASKHDHRFKLEPLQKAAPAAVAPPASRDSNVATTTTVTRHTPTAVYVGLVATGVFAAAATTTGVITMSKNKDFLATNDPTEGDRIAKSGKTFALLTDIGIGAALLSAGATAYFYFSAPKDSAQAETAQRRVRLTPVAGYSSAGVTIEGAF
jgi:hypothetical protein